MAVLVAEMRSKYVQINVRVTPLSGIKQIYHFYRKKTDYNVGKYRIEKAPEWEREFKLKILSEKDVMRWFNSLCEYCSDLQILILLCVYFVINLLSYLLKKLGVK